MPTNEEVLAAVRVVIRDVTGISIDELGLEKSFTDDLDLDSLAVVEIAVAIGDRLSVHIPDQDIKDLATVSDLLIYVMARLD